MKKLSIMVLLLLMGIDANASIKTVNKNIRQLGSSMLSGMYGLCNVSVDSCKVLAKSGCIKNNDIESATEYCISVLNSKHYSELDRNTQQSVLAKLVSNCMAGIKSPKKLMSPKEITACKAIINNAEHL